ncbi:hypothetical protein ABIC28_001556 [Rhodococcus sp. PvR044]|jgi:hypothetical protein|uniref:hypothetical protein n=1 Tax=Rhodococcus TaxID=1827 RepID=UPI000BDA17AF|nr:MULTISPECIES: hypothetical protein [Rhodococcus]MBP1161415.1 hypothetical protein [Rhodococcus sp. PvR099]MCZ4555941.1 hypothetical protein [Rhodococcus maanshanensis]PTR44581.1 hypothetical protein C8K38_10375 [Rhodococcus sp. OK611]SNX90022.1 hypothetical protein SAMN05447004_10475 [Rhodococcus sp. OK270]
MTRATKSTPVSVPAPAEQAPTLEVVPPAPESTTLSSALRLAQLAALGFARGTGGVAKGTGVVAKGTGALSLYLGRQGYTLARKALSSRPKAVPALALVDEQAVAAVAAEQVKGRGRRRGRRALLVVGLGAAVAAGAVYLKERRREVPPVAPAPPSLQDFENS